MINRELFILISQRRRGKKCTDEERDLNFAYIDKFAVVEGCEIGEEFEELMSGEDISYGKIIKKIF